VRSMLTISGGKVNIELDELGLKTKDDLVGIAGFFTIPKYPEGEQLKTRARFS
jgi:hypothetical protein